MALGTRQRKELDEFIAIAIRQPDIIRFDIIIGKQRQYTREFGRGMSITVTVVECYEDGDYRLTGAWIADCQYDYTAIEKGKEIANYIVEAGIAKERVKLAQRGR